MATGNRTLDILVIGAGQAGLVLGYHLKATPFRFQLVEGHRRVGDSWRKRYDSLVLFTPRAYSALPGLRVSVTRKTTRRRMTSRITWKAMPAISSCRCWSIRTSGR